MSGFEKCKRCGQYIGFENHVVSSPYGGVLDYEPPDFEFICLECWDGIRNKKSFWATRFTKPVIVRNGVKYHYDPESDTEIARET
jgi:hypothetical protein